MQRVKIEIPTKVLFSNTFVIQNEDINEANHMGNERILVFANTIREKMFESLKLQVIDNVNKCGIIVANHSIYYKSEGFLGDEITCEVSVDTITECSFDLIFHFIKNNEKSLAILRTGCVYYEYHQRKIKHLPEAFVQAFNS